MFIMSKYEVINLVSGHSFGIYEADSEESAIEACVIDAGYKSVAQMKETLETTCDDLVAVEVE